jgi:hypothetical protein
MAYLRNCDTTRTAADIAETTAYTIDLEKASSASVQAVYSDSAPPAKNFADGNVSVANDTITISSHGFITGTKVAATSSGTLPAGLSTTNYWVIKSDANTIKLASSLANASAGTAVNITAAAGGGTHTLTPAASTGNVCKLQEGNDSSNWTDVSGSTVTIATTAGNAVWNYTGSSRYLRVLYTPSAGQVNLALFTNLVKTSS